MEHDLNLHVKTTIQMVSAELGRFPWRRLLFLPEWVYAQRLWKYNGEKNSLEFLMKMLFQYTDKPEFPSNSKMYCCWDSERDSFSENWVVDFTVGCFSEDLFNFLRRCGFLSQSGLNGRREHFSFAYSIVDPFRFISKELTYYPIELCMPWVFGEYSNGKNCSRNASSKGAVWSFFHPLQCEMGRKTFIL